MEYNEKSLNIRLSIFGECHPDVAMSYNNIGGVYYSQCDYAKALEYYEKSLEISLSIFGECHPDTVDTVENIAVSYLKMEDYENALLYIKRGAAAGSENCANFLRDNGVE